MSNGGSFLLGEYKPQIKPIQTRYRNHFFRCRGEARWAVFFDWLGIEWEYEKDGYVVDGIPYLPDFWLPLYGIWVEIKGERPKEKEMELAKNLAKKTGRAVFVFHGNPCLNWGTGYYWPNVEVDSGHKLIEDPVTPGFMDEIDHFNFISHTVPDGMSYADSAASEYLGVFNSHFCSHMLHSKRLLSAARMAAEARFEHGADPRPPWLR